MYPQKMMVLLIEQLQNFGKMLKGLMRGRRVREREKREEEGRREGETQN